MVVISRTVVMKQPRGTIALVGIAASHFDEKNYQLSLHNFLDEMQKYWMKLSSENLYPRL